MSKQATCIVEIRAGHDDPRRAVAFLRHEKVGYVDAYEIFAGFDDDTRDHFKTSFDYWINDPFKPRPHRFHGWDQSEFGGKYQECFVFKCPPHRLYGFLCHPKKPNDGRFLACILVLHAEKHGKRTKEVNLQRAETMRQAADVHEALKNLFLRGKS